MIILQLLPVTYSKEIRATFEQPAAATNEIQLALNRVTFYVSRRDAKNAARAIWRSTNLALIRFALHNRIKLKTYSAKNELVRCLTDLMLENSLQNAVEFSASWSTLSR